MGAKTLEALEDAGAVYLNAIGGAAQFYARRITRVDGVSLMEFGTPEAMWHLWLEDFPAIVTMDAHGNSLHKDVERDFRRQARTAAGVTGFGIGDGSLGWNWRDSRAKRDRHRRRARRSQGDGSLRKRDGGSRPLTLRSAAVARPA